MNDFEAFFRSYEGPLIDKWLHYFPIYERHFSRFRGRPINLLEFGVSQGGSLRMWRSYFGADINIWGVDINPNCIQFADEKTQIIIGDQENRAFLHDLATKLPPIDILIDDGGHTMRQQLHTFEECFSCVQANGVYLIEDLHTSYWKRWGGGFRKRGTFIEYSKNLVDSLNAWHSQDKKRFAVDGFTTSIESMHYYDSVLVIEKKPMTPPTRERRGTQLFDDYEHKSPRLIDQLRQQFKGKSDVPDSSKRGE